MNVYKAIKEAWDFVDRKLKRLFILLLLSRVLTNFFDLLGTALMAILVGYVVSILSGNPNLSSVEFLVNLLQIQNSNIRIQVLILGIFTLLIFILRPLIVMPISKFLSFKIHEEGAFFTNLLFKKFTFLPLSYIRSWSTPEINYVHTNGIQTIIRLLWTSVALISDALLVIMFFFALFISNPIITLGLLFYVFLLFGLLGWLNGTRMRDSGEILGKTSSDAIKNINETVSMYRELYVSNRLNYQILNFQNNRLLQGKSIALVDWLSQVPRFVIDTALVLGVVVVAVGQAGAESIASAASSTTLFLTSALRILPTIAPIQGSINGIKNMQGLTSRVHIFSRYVEEKYEKRVKYFEALKSTNSFNNKFEVDVQSLSFQYPSQTNYALENITFKINSGTTLAIIGSSGSGKTTLADCILGLLEPTSGKIEIGENSPEKFIEKYPGAIAYVSQDVSLFDGSILENIAFALPDELVDLQKVDSVLKKAHIFDFVQSLPQGINTIVGERGTRLSGGQRQRIGIARALYGDPKILVLDEATSSLDAETEFSITSMLKELHGQVTIISIAHRLSTVMHSDLVLFLRDGHLAGSGKFDELVQLHPDLARQAELLGLDIEQD
ncbi:MAG: ABC transporter ATP-binding protein [Actinomycetes bacterium]